MVTKQSVMQKNVGIIAHGDADGLCSAALIKTMYPGALVLFSRAQQLHKVIKDVERRIITTDLLFIVDVAISNKVKDYVFERLRKSKSKYKIYYYDNHVLPEGMNGKSMTEFVDQYRSEKETSSSVIVFKELYGDALENRKKFRFQAMLAVYGAISDYARNCHFLRSMLDLYDESNAYYQAFLLKQASRVIDDENLKRTIVDKLSVGILPSEIFEVVEAARMASREVDVAMNFIQSHALKFGDLGIIIECPVASMGHNAFIAATMTDARIGVAIRRQGGKAHFVFRRRHNEVVHLGLLASEVASSCDGDGGGEEATAGITVEDTRIDEIIRLLSQRLDDA